MKKVFYMMVAVLLLGTSVVLGQPGISVDGLKDPFYGTLTGPDDGYLQIRSYANSDNGRPKNDADLSAKVWVAWDDAWFYYYTEVVDDTVSGGGTSNSYEGDNLELKIDPRATDSTQTGSGIFDMRLSAPFAETGGVVDTSLRSSIAATDKQWARRLMTGGYALEFAVKWSAIKLSSSDSVHVGVDSVFGVGINVHDNDGHSRQASIIWAAAMLDHIWDTPKLLGTVKFLAGNKLSFIPSNNMTGLTNPVPYDGSEYFRNIVVDGQKDGFYQTLNGPSDGYLRIRSYANSDNGRPKSDADLSSQVWTAWDQDWFYLYTEVRDDTVSGGGTSNSYEGDNLELKIDPRATDSTQTGGSIFDMRLSAPFAETGGVVDTSLRSSIAAADKKFARRTMTGGYALEFAVKLTAIKLSASDSLHAGVDSVFGFGLNVHDNDGHSRQASIIWAAAMLDHIWDTPKLLGTVKFLAGNKLSFIPTNNMTGLTNPVPYDGSEYFRNIVVDGQKDGFYQTLNGPSDGYLRIRSYANSDNGRPKSDADLSSQVWTAWDQDWFYLYTEVRDDTVSGGGTSNSYEGDNLELKIDPRATDSTQTGGSIFDMRLSAPFAETGGVVDTSLRSSIAAADKKFARRTMTGGYALEFAVKLTAIKLNASDSLHAGVDSVFGFGLNVHDNDGHSRQASIIWAAAMLDHIWDTPKLLGTVKFLAGNKLSFIPTNNMTGLTNPVPYDGSDYFNVVVDGQKDAFYTTLNNPDDGYLQIGSGAYSTNGPPKNDADLSAKVWTSWDPTWFYLYTEVRDDTVSGGGTSNSYEGDNLELKIDPRATDSTQTGGSIFDVRLSAPFTETGGVVDTSLRSSIAAADKKFARRTMTGGYALELAMKWTAIKLNSTDSVRVGVDSVFGFGLNVHDNDGHSRQASVIWAAFLDDHVWDTPKLLGTLKFATANRLKYIATNNMTGRTGHTYKYDGTDLPLGVEREEGVIPIAFSLSQNYPNPFNPTTTISYSIPSSSHVRLTVYDILGRQVTVLMDEMMEPGNYKASFGSGQWASGVYFYRLEAGRNIATHKMMLLK